jgi:hypothetical protein
MKVYWAISDKLHFLIRDLYSVHRKVIDTYQKNQQESSSSATTHSSRSGNSYTWQNNARLPILAEVSLSDYHSQNASIPSSEEPQQPLFQSLNNTGYNNNSSFDYWLQQQQERRK